MSRRRNPLVASTLQQAGLMVGRISIKILVLSPPQTQRALWYEGHVGVSLGDHRAQLGILPFLKGLYMVVLFHLQLMYVETRLSVKRCSD